MSVDRIVELERKLKECYEHIEFLRKSHKAQMAALRRKIKSAKDISNQLRDVLWDKSDEDV